MEEKQKGTKRDRAQTPVQEDDELIHNKKRATDEQRQQGEGNRVAEGVDGDHQEAADSSGRDSGSEERSDAPEGSAFDADDYGGPGFEVIRELQAKMQDIHNRRGQLIEETTIKLQTMYQACLEKLNDFLANTSTENTLLLEKMQAAYMENYRLEETVGTIRLQTQQLHESIFGSVTDHQRQATRKGYSSDEASPPQPPLETSRKKEGKWSSRAPTLPEARVHEGQKLQS
ncbi:hypothetical protein QOT17_009494 [Balamuthia mandrillaris]